jgi:hypothetical protein
MSMLVDARSYAGTYTYSDHKLLVAKIDFGKVHLCFKRPKTTKIKFNTTELTSNGAMQGKFHSELDEALSQ